jgi:AAHS family 4-hydroxybenzoate transporter-like MFS transporter
MLGLGRFGGIAGSFLVAELSRRQLGFGEIFTVVAVPAWSPRRRWWCSSSRTRRTRRRPGRRWRGAKALGH